MKIVLLALNAKYIHPSLALRYIKAFDKEYDPYITLVESTINSTENEIIKKIYNEKPDILGISCYIWNMQLVKCLLPTLKLILPETTIVLGGPEVSFEAESLTSQVDFIMEGEGEETWKEFLDYKIKGIGHLEQIAGLIYKKGEEMITTPPRKPLNLEKLPFVYDNLELIKNKILYYEASRGCPFNCQYCLSSTDKGVRFVPVEIVKEHLNFFLKERVKQVKFVDRTFNTKKQYALEIWKHLIEHDNGETNFHFEIAAELINDEMIDVLASARPGLFQFEIGVQSTNLKVLEAIDRKMPYEAIKEVVNRIKSLNNIHQHLDLIAGLPYEDYASFKQSFNDVIALRPEQFQLGFLKLLKGSGLRRDANKYGIIYKNEPPYEVLYTDSISYDEILKLHMIEELVERYYNSGRFTYSLEYLFEVFDSPFDFFESLAHFWEAEGLDVIAHNKIAYALHLLDFGLTMTPVNDELLKEYLRFDTLKIEKVKELPSALQNSSSDTNNTFFNHLLKDDNFIETQLPHLLPLAPRQRYKFTHLESFNYNILDCINTKEYSITSKSFEPIKIFFDYFNSQVHYFLL